ncbi:MAG: helix-turn-helix domain-containing protein [Candidatus Cloacimonetes bacterium]|nr:helix-turn-helix domain-containing protein [Candidatus Cloacimonadota bacterium]
MESLGKYLQDLRIKRDYSYKKVWEDIRTREDIIRKMENNRFSEVGDYGITKAVVYNYARYLEADLDMVMHEFSIVMPEEIKDKFNPHIIPKDRKIMLSTNFLWMVGILIFVAILASFLFHARNKGWLQTPDFFLAKTADSTAIAKPKQEEAAKPDTLRQRMRALSEAIPKTSNTPSKIIDKNTIPPDTTDYIGNILGDSPVNVPLY